MKRFIKHTDIHLRIRTLIAEAGRELRAATETIEDGKGCRFLRFRSFSKELLGQPVTWGWPEVMSVHVGQFICQVGLFDNQLLGSEYTESPAPHGCTSCAE